jgi:predicted acylesterase/phospholipase RssA
MSKPWTVKILIITGGAAKGVAYLGALSPFVEQLGDQFLKEIPIMVGASIGAMICASFQLGASLQEVRDVFTTNDLRKLLPSYYDKPQGNTLRRLTEKFSIDDGKAFDAFLRNSFTKRGKDPDTYTFRQLHEETKRTLIVTGSCLNTMKPCYYSWRTTPDMLVCQAIRITSGLPYIFPPIVKDRMMYVDGACYDPFPVRALSKKERKQVKQGNMLGIVGYTLDQTFDIKDIQQMTYAFAMGLQHNYMEMSTERYKKHIIRVPLSLSTSAFNVSSDESDELFLTGRHAGTQFISKKGLPLSSSRYDELHTKSLAVPVPPDKEESEVRLAPEHPDPEV